MKRIVEVVSGPWTGLRGEITKSSGGVLRVRIGDGRNALVRPSHVRDIPAEDPAKHDTLSPAEEGFPYDFSESGLGIGGLATYEEPQVMPSEATIERIQRMMDTDVMCRVCGASKNFDGAMFTTLGGDICDDCA